MYPVLLAVFHWLRTHEQSLAIWLEGIALVAIFVLELKEYRRQGSEREEQHKESVAQMAIMQSQADALVNSERAWVTLEGITTNMVAKVDNTINVVVAFKNYGKTPAWIVESSLRFVMERPHLLEQRIAYGESALPAIRPLPPGQPFTLIRHLEPAATLGGKDWDLVLNGEVSFFLYGFVKYRDSLSGPDSKLRETSICFEYRLTPARVIVNPNSGDWLIAGPRKANDYT